MQHLPSVETRVFNFGVAKILATTKIIEFQKFGEFFLETSTWSMPFLEKCRSKQILAWFMTKHLLNRRICNINNIKYESKSYIAHVLVYYKISDFSFGYHWNYRNLAEILNPGRGALLTACMQNWFGIPFDRSSLLRCTDAKKLITAPTNERTSPTARKGEPQ
jgi:hypothetical protein